MIRNKMSWVVYGIIGLAVIGLISQLFTNTTGFLKSIVFTIGIGVIIFGAFYFIFIRPRNKSKSDDMSKYKQAVKQSKMKYQQNTTQSMKTKNKKQPVPLKRKSNRRASHLRVIDGNKSKSKNRASH